MIELTVLGCSGSYGAPAGGACSGYLVRAGGETIWLDCGNGTLPALQRHADPADLTAVVITHQHPDHCADLYGLHVLNRYGLERFHLPVFAAHPRIAERARERGLRAVETAGGDAGLLAGVLEWFTRSSRSAAARSA